MQEVEDEMGDDVVRRLEQHTDVTEVHNDREEEHKVPGLILGELDLRYQRWRQEVEAHWIHTHSVKIEPKTFPELD